MAEKKVVKPRICWTCHETIETTARGMKEHYKVCKKNKNKEVK